MPRIEFKRTMFEEIDASTKTFEDKAGGLQILKLAYNAYKKSGDLSDFVMIALGTKRVQQTREA
jgi:hypothetical protein